MGRPWEGSEGEHAIQCRDAPPCLSAIFFLDSGYRQTFWRTPFEHVRTRMRQVGPKDVHISPDLVPLVLLDLQGAMLEEGIIYLEIE
jgi:hypothetical protein